MKVHTTGGYLTHVACGYKHAYGVEDGDVMGCVADIGWAVGHGVNFYGNLLNGGTALLFESLPNFPDPGRGSMDESDHSSTVQPFALISYDEKS